MADPTARDEASHESEPIVPDDLAYEPPPELAEDGASGVRRRPPPRSVALRIAAAAGVLLVVAAALLAYRAHHRRKVVASTLSAAEALMRLDTAAAYRRAASLLEPIAKLDPVHGGSARAFALAMLAVDHGDVRRDREIEDLLVAPGRADEVPLHARLAAAAVALRAKEAGTAMAALARAGPGPWTHTLTARVALLAGNVEAAVQSAGNAGDALPAGLAVHGDALRRLRTDPAAGRAEYEAALAASPLHPRAAYGLAKLALGGSAPREEAERALERIVEDRDATPPRERARAALHLASLRLRAGDRAGADAALGAVPLEPAARAWAHRAATIAAERRGTYRAVAGAPPSLQSACDDDPGDLSPTPPPASAGPKAVAKKGSPAKVAKKAAAKRSKASDKHRAGKTARAKAPGKTTAAKASTGTRAVKEPAAKRTPAPTTSRR